MLRPVLACLILAAPAHAEGLLVTADIAPVQSLVTLVLGEAGEAATLLPQGDSAHHLSLRPSQARALTEADIVIWTGPALMPSLGEALQMLAPDTPRLTLQDVPGTLALPYRDAEDFGGHDHADDHEHGDEHSHDEAAKDEAGHDVHDHAGGIDSHLWLSPDNARLWLNAIAAALAEQDPGNAATFRANAEAARALVDQAAAEAAASLAPVAGLPLAVDHDAFQYFEAHFGLTVIGAISDSEAAPAGPATLAALRDRVAEAKPVCVLVEPDARPGLIEAIGAAGLPRATLDPLGSDLEPGADLYPALIRAMANRIAACATGS
ncbi:zinc ABC transporter substrate-binding protein [Thetidibacter halocola]|uniref:High-affinity zinc uptake system protein ZnuA n=1 Tax=Thetidibacter halocola TaxID=2827239 RepID=A0A8J7WCX7_9RHOB|nr:zinc ABC transporter substrate-binding protein [Thetidibacter halocola]MBS0123083.1 zinc ABC transporter substrate-binding protein [Thetidibacter halocola]